jgi:hypothetical protein
MTNGCWRPGSVSRGTRCHHTRSKVRTASSSPLPMEAYAKVECVNPRYPYPSAFSYFIFVSALPAETVRGVLSRVTPKLDTIVVSS